jgi:hypothetical protein
VLVDPVLRTSGLRAVAVAMALWVGIVAARLWLHLLVVGGWREPDDPTLVLWRTGVGLTATVVGALWIWGALRAALGDRGVGRGLLGLAGTVAIAAVAMDTMGTIDPLLVERARLGVDASASLADAARLCRIGAEITLIVAIARVAWLERSGLAMVAAAIALVIAAPLLVLDPFALAAERSSTGAWLAGLGPTAGVSAAVIAAAMGLRAWARSPWEGVGRALELVRAALVARVGLAAGFASVLAFGDPDPARRTLALALPVALVGCAAALGLARAARASIRVARWSLGAAAIAVLAAAGIEVWVGVALARDPSRASAGTLAPWVTLAQGLYAVALVLLVVGVARIDRLLQKPALAVGVLLPLGAAAATAAIVLRHNPALARVGLAPIGLVLLALGIAVLVLLLRLLGRGIALAASRARADRARIDHVMRLARRR